MPFVNIKIVRGRPEETKGTVKSIMDATGFSADQIWVVFEEVEQEDWFVGSRSVKEIRAKK